MITLCCFFEMLLSCLLFAENVKFLLQFTPGGCYGCHTKNSTTEFESPWDLRPGFFLFSFHKLDKLTGIRAKIWIWKVVLFRFIRNNNRAWDFGKDLLFLCLPSYFLFFFSFLFFSCIPVCLSSSCSFVCAAICCSQQVRIL